MILHSTFTNGYFGYAKLFLDSFKHSNNDDLKIVFTTTDLSVDEISQLKDLYRNLIVHNNKFDYEPICKELGITKEKVKKLKYEAEHRNVKSHALGHRWKMHVAAEKRVKVDLPFVMKKYESENLIAHFDIDMYFKKSLNKLFAIMEKHDFTVMYRPHLIKEWRKIWICAMGIKTKNSNASNFIEEWGNELDKIPLRNKPYAYGQTSCYRVYKRFLEYKNIQFGNIPEDYILAGRIGTEDALILSGNKASIGKDKILNRFTIDFNRRV